MPVVEGIGRVAAGRRETSMPHTYPEWVCTDCGATGVGEIEWINHVAELDCENYEEVS